MPIYSGGGGTPALSAVLGVGNNTGGAAIVRGDSSLALGGTTTTLESDQVIEIHATEQDIDITADWSNINISTTPDGGGIQIDAARAISIISRLGSAQITGSGAVPVIVQSSGDYAQIESESAAVRLLANGSMWLHLANSPIDDNDLLGPGFFGLWFDDTNGAAKFFVKGKTVDGTVVSGFMALT